MLLLHDVTGSYEPRPSTCPRPLINSRGVCVLQHTHSVHIGCPNQLPLPPPSRSLSNARVIGFCGCVKGLPQSNQEVLRSPCVGPTLNNPLIERGWGWGGGPTAAKGAQWKNRDAIRLGPHAAIVALTHHPGTCRKRRRGSVLDRLEGKRKWHSVTQQGGVYMTLSAV